MSNTIGIRLNKPSGSYVTKGDQAFITDGFADEGVTHDLNIYDQPPYGEEALRFR